MSALDLSTPTQIAALEAENAKLRGDIRSYEITMQRMVEVDAVEARERAALRAEVARLTEGLEDLTSWFDGGPSSYGPWIITAGPHGADEAVEAARDTLAALKGSTDAQA